MHLRAARFDRLVLTNDMSVNYVGLAGMLLCSGNGSSLEHRPLQPSGMNSSLYFIHIDLINFEKNGISIELKGIKLPLVER